MDLCRQDAGIIQMTQTFLMTLASDCPFCGHSNDLEVVDSKEGPAKVVKCWACGAIGPYGASNEELAVSFWNKRTQRVITMGSSATNEMMINVQTPSL